MPRSMPSSMPSSMRVRLMHPDRAVDPAPPLVPHEAELVQDLALDVLLSTMSAGDAFLLGAARTALLTAAAIDVETIRYRHAVMQDCIAQAAVVRELYALAVEAADRSQRGYFGYLVRSSDASLSSAVSLLEIGTDILRRLRQLADRHASHFTSAGFTTLFAALQRDLSDEYLDTIERHLELLQFRQGILVSARLGARGEGTDYVLRLARDQRPYWIRRLLGAESHGYTIHIDERDEAGARFLGDLRNRGTEVVARVVTRAARDVLTFFQTLRAELAFYVACVNGHDRLTALGIPTCWPELVATSMSESGSMSTSASTSTSAPTPEPSTPELATVSQPGDAPPFHASELSDVCLALRLDTRVVTNTIQADGKRLVIITGANQGGKSSFLRAVGVAQLMLGAGMFVGATAMTAPRYRRVFTHYKREEAPTMTMGKFDEELARLSDIVDAIEPGTLLLLNESFAATNEREGSEIARQIVTTLAAHGVTVWFVTHLFAFADALAEQHRPDTLFLRAERRPDGTRTFHIDPGLPLETSYGPDLYQAIFGTAPPAV